MGHVNPLVGVSTMAHPRVHGTREHPKEMHMRSKLVIGGLTAAVAFLLATNPVVVDAAGQITGADIKNGTVTGKDIKNNSVKGKDIKESSLKTVPHAADAANLGGKAPGTYLNQSYRYRLPTGSPATTKTFSFPGLPAGNYLVTYMTAIQGGAQLYCQFSADNFASGEAVSFSVGTGSLVNHGSTVLAVASSPTAALRCQSGANFQVYAGADAKSSVTFTRIDGLADMGVSGVTRPATAANNGFAR
jgi:hypothetical protein